MPVHVGTIVRPKGLGGEVVADLPSGDPGRLAERDTFLLEEADGRLSSRRVASMHPQGRRMVIHLEGCGSLAEARGLAGRRLFLEPADLPPLPPNRYYAFLLLGARVLADDGRDLGEVIGTEPSPAHDLLVVRRRDGQEAQVPMTEAIVRRIDEENGVVIVDAPPGLLEGEAETVAGDDGGSES